MGTFNFTTNSVPSSTGGAGISPSSVIDSAVGGVSNFGSSLLNSFEGAIDSALSAASNELKNLTDLGDIASSIKKSLSITPVPSPPPYANILGNYASYNYIFTLSCISDDSLNNPGETYKKGNLGQLILKSGSTDSKNRVSIEGFGSFEFYIEDIEIDSVIGFQNTSGNTNACSLAFKIIEPYSTGMFFHAIQAASNQMGHSNYTDAPFLLTLQFIGHINADNLGISGDSISPIEKTTRHFPIKLCDISMKTTAAGSEYSMTAVPYNQTAMTDSYIEVKTDTTISGQTVHELLQTGPKSLQRVINDRLQKVAQEQKLKVRDQVVIYFPNDAATGGSSSKSGINSATVNPSASSPNIQKTLKLSESNINKTLVQNVSDISPLGKASMNFSAYSGTSTPFAKDDLVYNEKTHVYTRGNINIMPNQCEMKFTQNSNVVNIINQVMVMSDYGRQALTAKQVSDGKGMIPWWKIESMVYNIPTEINQQITGTKPKLIVYRVIPYMVDVSTFLPPDKVNPHIEERKKQAVKEYNYIYTAKNVDVIDFNLEFKSSFFQSMLSNTGQNSGDVATQNKNAPIANEPNQANKDDSLVKRLFGDVDKLGNKVHDAITKIRFDKTKSSNSDKGGAGLNNPDTLMAKQAHDIIISSDKDMIAPEITIMGDPFYIADSGIGNYTAKSTNYENINADHSMNYQNGQVDIIVNFRTPLDLNMQTGTANFGDTKLISQFSGLYMVQQVHSKFSKGKFTQTLEMIRRNGQS